MGVPREQRLVPLSLVSDANGARRETAVWRALFFRSPKLAGRRYISMRGRVTLSRHTSVDVRTHKLRSASQPARQTRLARAAAGRQAAGSTPVAEMDLRKSFSKENDCTTSQPACTAPNATGETGVAPFVRAAEARKVRTPEWGGTASSCAKRNREQFVHFCIYCADDRIPRPEVAARGSLLFSTASARIGS